MKQRIFKNFYLNANELEIDFFILVDRYIYTGEQLNKHSIYGLDRCNTTLHTKNNKAKVEHQTA